jgi:hypothetical protein
LTLVDTDILIWYLRGNTKAAKYLESLSFSISAVTYKELVQGMRNKEELQILRATLKNWNIDTVHIDNSISAKAMFYVEEHFLSHNLRLADSLVAATAVSCGMDLATANIKHYKSIKELQLTPFKPK